ncbi:transposase [Streptomyces nigra]|uniref:transposase n=1 Tax=Streptomyces nigra TaxID=1827580 RepID=UPI0037D4FD92
MFADQVGARSDQLTGRTWGEKGRTPVVRRSGNRFSVNAMSVISTKGRMHFMVFTEHFTAGVMCRFLERITSYFDHKVLCPRSGRTRRRDPSLLQQTSATAAHRPRLLRQAARPIHPGREPHDFLINR